MLCLDDEILGNQKMTLKMVLGILGNIHAILKSRLKTVVRNQMQSKMTGRSPNQNIDSCNGGSSDILFAYLK